MPNPPRIMKNRFVVMLLLCACMIATALDVHATTADDVSQDAPVPVPADLLPELQSVDLATDPINETIEAIGARDDLEGHVRQQIIDIYQRSLEALSQARTWQERALEWEQHRQAAAGEREAVERDLAVPLDPRVEVPLDATIEALRQLRDQTDADLRAAQERSAELEREQIRRTERRQEIPAEIAAARSALEEVQQALSTTPPAEQLSELVRARRTEQRAIERLNQLIIESLQLELASYDARTELLPLRRERASRRIVQREAMLREWRQVVERRAAEEAEREAEQARRAAAEASPVVREIAEQSLELIERRTGPDGLLTRTQQMREQYDDMQAQLVDLVNRYERDRQRVIVAGMEGLTDVRLRAQRAEMPDLRMLRREVRERRQEISRVQRELADLEYERSALPPLVMQRNELLALVDPSTPEDVLAEITVEIDRRLSQQRAQYDALIEAYREYEDWLVQVQEAQVPLTALVTQYIKFIDERILWIRSADSLGTRDASLAWQTMQRFVDPVSWREVFTAWWSHYRANPIPGMIVFGLLGLYFLSLHRLRKRLRHVATLVPLSHNDRFSLTVQTLFITMALAAFWPAVLFFIAWRISASAQSPELAETIAAGLSRTAAVLFTINFVQQMTCSSGLADAHFRWRRETRLMLRRHLRWLLMVLLPLTFIVASIEWEMKGAGSDAFSRFAFIASMLALAVFVARVLQPDVGIVRHVISQNTGGWLERLQYVWYPLAIVVPLALAGLAAAGYYYTALQLADRLVVSIWFIIILINGHGLVLRWLFIARRNLAIEEARKRRAAAAQAAESGEPVDIAPAESGPIAVEEQKIDLNVIDAQARQLLRSAVGFTFLLGMWFIWAKMLPALGMLDRIEIWPDFGNIREAAIAPPPAHEIVGPFQPGLFESVPVSLNGSTVVPAANSNQNGAEIPGDRPPPPFTGEQPRLDAEARAALAAAAAPDPEVITLANVIIAIFIVIIAIVITKNIPGLLEITLLKKLPLEPSGRYAVTTLTRYILIVFGTIFAFGAIGIGWTQVQWLVAAITLGIGFGLQEIVANFISGIIILFEQPIRVGDTITVGNVSGTVTKIRMRATTVVDWDRKELIIPNKEFITGQVINWTLSDPVLRLVIPVGIAYGSDTAKAEQELLRVAETHPIVLKDPPPSVVFSEFGDSSLNFNLRVFIPHIGEFIKVRHEMHNAIDRAFREAGIEIAFPQRDIHIRNIKAELPVEFRDQRAERRSEK